MNSYLEHELTDLELDKGGQMCLRKSPLALAESRSKLDGSVSCSGQRAKLVALQSQDTT